MGLVSYQGKTVTRQQENNAIINHVVDEILLNETKKVSATREVPECLDSDYGENNLYHVVEWVFKRRKKQLNDVSMRLNAKRKVYMWLKTIIIWRTYMIKM